MSNDSIKKEKIEIKDIDGMLPFESLQHDLNHVANLIWNMNGRVIDSPEAWLYIIRRRIDSLKSLTNLLEKYILQIENEVKGGNMKIEVGIIGVCCECQTMGAVHKNPNFKDNSMFGLMSSDASKYLMTAHVPFGVECKGEGTVPQAIIRL